MRRYCLLVYICLSSVAFGQDGSPVDNAATATAPQTVADLVNEVREGSESRRAQLADRERRFIEAREQQANLLAEARRQREQEEAEADRLRELYQQGEEDLAQLEDRLTENTGNLGNVFTVVTQVAGDALPLIQNSMVSAQYGDRLPMLEALSGNQSMPTAQQLRELWLLLLDEMVHSGEVARFQAPVITGGGEEVMRQVTRIGTFSALADGQYLRFLPESGRLLALARQPVGTATGSIREFESASEPLVPVAIDPSRGSILSLIVQTPDLSERVQQGGMIGYLILALGAIGLLLGLERIVVLAIASHRAKLAYAEGGEAIEHPINEIRRVAGDPHYLADVDAASAKLDEIVATAAQKLRRGLPTLAIFAAVSPLLGLLGTVTGMIETFQVITLFGAGDPRLMSGGISQALITTQLGLAVAIPLLLVHSWLQGRANNLVANLDEIAADQFASGRANEADHAA